MGNERFWDDGVRDVVDEDDPMEMPPAVLRSVLERLAAEEAARPRTPEVFPMDESLDGPPPILLDESTPLWRPTVFFAGLSTLSAVVLGILWWMVEGGAH